MSDYEDDEFDDPHEEKPKIIESSRSNAKPLNNHYQPVSASPSPNPIKCKSLIKF